MKKILSFLFCLFLFCSLCAVAFGDSGDDWTDAPVISSVYESGKEQIVVEWEGNAVLYQVYLDGKKASTVNLNGTILDVKAGRHQIQIVPIQLKSKDVDSNFSLEFGGFGGEKSLLSLGTIGINVDLAALGVDPKDILQGSRSQTFAFTYAVSPIYNAVPEVTAAATDPKDQVVLSFTDKYNADLYRIGIKSGKDVNYVEFDPADAATADFVAKNNTAVAVTLDTAYLRRCGCMIPELDQKYSFSVILEKYAANQVDNSPVITMVHESKESKFFNYTPYASWKNAPEITYASQTADGQITLQWTHDDNGLGCQYTITQSSKILGVKKGQKVVGTTVKKEWTVPDLMNGNYYYIVTPQYSYETGTASEEVSVEVKNDWVAAPTLTLNKMSGDQIRLAWPSAEGVESYHIVAYAGSGSLLRVVNMDFKKYAEYDVLAKQGNMEFVFTYGQDAISENGAKFRFEIYGVRHSLTGAEQRSSSSRQMIIVR